MAPNRANSSPSSAKRNPNFLVALLISFVRFTRSQKGRSAVPGKNQTSRERDILVE